MYICCAGYKFIFNLHFLPVVGVLRVLCSVVCDVVLGVLVMWKLTMEGGGIKKGRGKWGCGGMSIIVIGRGNSDIKELV
jgi:hypothetical protein